MPFWIYITLMDLIIPVTMIFFGLMFSKRVPKKINRLYGYRTAMSTKNMDTWEFAHKYCGKFWYRIGFVTLPLPIIVMLFFIGKDENTISFAGGVICIIETFTLIIAFFATEIALHKNFDKNGNRKINTSKKGN